MRRQDRVGPSLNAQGPAVDEGVGHGAAGFRERAAKGVPGNAHPFRALTRGQPFQIGQPQGFKPFYGQHGFGKLGHGNAARLEIGNARLAFDIAAVAWPWHPSSRILFK